MKKILITLAAVLWLCPPGFAAAQDAPTGKWWRLPRVAKRLNLSQEEKKKLDELFTQSRRNLIRLKSKVEEERFELEDLLEKEFLDESAVMEQFRRLEKARNDLAEERFRFLLGVRKIIGFERFELLKGIYRHFRQRARQGKTGPRPWRGGP